MDVSRSHRIPVQQLQQNTSRSISGQRVRRRLQAVKVVLSILIAHKLSSQIVIALVLWVLEIVLPVRERLLDVEDGAWDAFSGQEICDFAVHQGWVSAWRWILDDASAELTEGAIGRPERTEDGGGWMRMWDLRPR